jgi:succinate dehydrogenase / fumarate reductase cytochrome b subunit
MGRGEVAVSSVRDRETANIGAGNWKGLGMWAWLLFRVAGVVLAVYLFVHIVVISQGRMSGASTLDGIFTTFDKPLFVLLDLLLVWAVLFHGLNGVRVLLMDVGVGVRSHKAVFVCAMVLAVALFVFFIAAAWSLVF